jgi:Uncharacterized conserved protein
MKLKIIASLTIENEKEEADIVKALHTVVDATRKEEGNISYELHQDIANPKTYVFVEVWKSPEAIDSHNNSAHFLDFVKAVEGKVALAVNVIKKVY